ncbi:uncharacterized protein LOC132479704 [Mesoplodon densirostris]|uniref:uncharacterized protein LOC132479704 n=1 Tax=Mesoplodon densirostris TaxID=48708 RepID=UPI0028DAF9D6|nr:uncharacterized protein LOC132479704 [Mesoplodon densirostris]
MLAGGNRVSGPRDPSLPAARLQRPRLHPQVLHQLCAPGIYSTPFPGDVRHLRLPSRAETPLPRSCCGPGGRQPYLSVTSSPRAPAALFGPLQQQLASAGAGPPLGRDVRGGVSSGTAPSANVDRAGPGEGPGAQTTACGAEDRGRTADAPTEAGADLPNWTLGSARVPRKQDFLCEEPITHRLMEGCRLGEAEGLAQSQQQEGRLTSASRELPKASRSAHGQASLHRPPAL